MEKMKENSQKPLHVLTTLADNLELSSQGTGPYFTLWQRAGITRVYNLVENGIFKTFQSLKAQYHISNKDFYKIYMSDIMCIRKPTHWNFQMTHLLETFFLDHKERKRFICTF